MASREGGRFAGGKFKSGRFASGRFGVRGGAAGPVSAIIYGQSEMEYLLNADSTYRQITQPTPGDGNLILFTQSGDGAAPVRTEVNATTVAAGSVNPAMAALSAWLDYVRPGRTFVIGDGAVPGTGRVSLHNDSDADSRLWSDFTSVVDAVEAETGQPVGNLIECWYNSDASRITDFKNAFWPSYFGLLGDGSTFTLGSTHSVTSSVVEYCLWDGTASASVKGRGIFARSSTLWHILTPMPFCDGPVSPTAELTSFSSGERLEEPARATMIALADDAMAQSVGVRVGPSAHLSHFAGGIHPVTTDPDGQINLMWPIAVSLARAAGLTIGEPTIVGVEGPDDGSYVDLLIDLPNGGTLSTLREFRGDAMPGTPSPHQQTVTGIEITRSGGARRPVYKTTETSYPIAHRGTVTIQDTGSGTPRRGRVRVTPEQAFGFGDSLSYLRGQATAILQEPRDSDNKLMLDHLIEHIPALYDAGALYPFEGVAVRPYQQDVTVTVPAPAFTARSAQFDGSTRYSSTSVSVAAGQNGLISCWFRNEAASWASGPRLLHARVGSSTRLEVNAGSAGQMQVQLHADGASNIKTFRTAGAVNFAINTWYHLLIGWTGTNTFQIYVNGSEITSGAIGSMTMAGSNITQVSFGSALATSMWTGDIGHLWCSVNQTLDLSVQANREKFALAGAPVNLGSDGSLPTGTAPEWYYDGIAPAWSNQGTAGNIPLTGALTSGGAPSY